MVLSFMYATQVLQYFSLQLENCLIFVSITYLVVHNVSPEKKYIFTNTFFCCIITARPRDTRPQVVRALQIHGFQLKHGDLSLCLVETRILSRFSVKICVSWKLWGFCLNFVRIFWSRNDCEKWLRKIHFEIPPCKKVFIFVTELIIWGKKPF